MSDWEIDREKERESLTIIISISNLILTGTLFGVVLYVLGMVAMEKIQWRCFFTLKWMKKINECFLKIEMIFKNQIKCQVNCWLYPTYMLSHISKVNLIFNGNRLHGRKESPIKIKPCVYSWIILCCTSSSSADQSNQNS